MKPIKLKMQAFGPFAKSTEIDFSKLTQAGIYLISGKTGSGKTTIFDAISYALYGKVSGNERQIDSLKSQFAPPQTIAEVEFEFEIESKNYLIKRSPTQERAKIRQVGTTIERAKCELVLPDKTTLSKKSEVDKKIIELIGLDSEQFAHIVMIAQGEFKKLLHARPEDRERIFRKLFNTRKYELIQNKLNEMQNELVSKIKIEETSFDSIVSAYNGEIIEELTIYTFDKKSFEKHLQETKSKIEKTITSKNNYQNKLEKVKQDLYSLDTYEKQKIELQKYQQELEQLNVQKPKIKQKSNQIEQLTKLIPLQKINVMIANTQKIIKEINSELDEQLNDQKTSEKELKNLDEKKILFKEKSQLIEMKKIKLLKLNDLEPQVAEYNNLKVEIAGCLKNIKKTKFDIEKAITQENEYNLQREVIKSDKDFEVDFNAKYNDLVKQEQELQNNIQDMKIILEQLQNVARLQSKLQQNLQKEDQILKELQSDLHTYQISKNLYYQNIGAILALELEPNKPCIVCGSTNHPNINKSSDKISKEELELIERQKDKKQQELLNVNVENKQYEKQINEIIDNLKISSAEVVTEISDYKKKIINLKECMLETRQKQEQIKIRMKKQKKLQQGYQYYNDEVIKLVNHNQTNIHNLSKSEQQLNIMQNQISELETRLAAENIDVIEYYEYVEKLNVTIENMQAKVDKYDNKYQVKKTKVQTISEMILKSKANLLQKQNEKKNQISEFEKKLKDLNISNDEYKKLETQMDNIIIMQKEVGDFEVKMKTTINYIKNIDSKLQNDPKLSRINLEKRTSIYQKQIVKYEEQHLNVKQQHQNLLQLIKNLSIIVSKMDHILEEARVVKNPALIASGRIKPYISFESYILASYFDEMIEKANLRLRTMTMNRYQLIRKQEKSKGTGKKGLELDVYDSYTSKLRDVKSLSGGESFKASLALALGMADVIEQNNGGIDIQMMFIDEGFGTLDSEALDQAITTLYELQQSGRSVGIISHVEELKNQIPTKINVKSGIKGSSLNIIN